MKDVKNAEITITGHLAMKKSKNKTMWYAVINLPKDKNGKRNEKWVSTGIEAMRGNKQINKREAQTALDKIRLEYSQIEHVAAKGLTKEERKTLSFANAPLDVYAKYWLEKHRKIQPTTYDSYNQLINCRINFYFTVNENLALKNIGVEDINSFYEYLYEQGLSESTAKKYHNVLHMIFGAAHKDGVIKEDPFDSGDIEVPQVEAYDATFYNASEMQQLLNNLGDDPLRVPVIIAAYYGLRRSEVLGIKWSAIDFENNSISIQHKVVVDKQSDNRLHCTNKLKTKYSRRSFRLFPEVKVELLKHKERQEKMQKLMGKSYCKDFLDYVCVDALGNLIKPGYVTEHFPLLLKKLNLKKIRFHDLRHSCASNLLSRGVQMKVIQIWLGHSKMSTTADLYTHVDPASKDYAAMQLEEAYSRKNKAEA